MRAGLSPAADRGRSGCKHHVITEAGGIPLAVLLTGGNRNDVTQLLPPNAENVTQQPQQVRVECHWVKPG